MSAYDEIRYNNLPNPITHPGRLHVLAKLAGLQPNPVETCRVLELGTSEGANLIGMAMGLPNAHFTGIDLAEKPVQRGRAVIGQLGLNNVTLSVGNLLNLDFDHPGRFDYILTHGIYGWTPPEVGERILEIVRTCLAPDGVAFISYNTQPAGHIRMAVRDMMLYHTRGIDDPVGQLKSAREFLALLATGRPEPDAFDAATASYAANLLQHSDSALFHDNFAPVYQPVYLHEFAARAAAHGLQYCGDAGGFEDPRNLKEEVVESVRTMGGGDPVKTLQYFDFFRMKAFRNSLLCHRDRTVKHGWHHGDLAGCFAHTTAVELEDGTFASADNIRMNTKHPLPIAYMRRLIEVRPHSIAVTPEEAHLILELFKVGIIELRGSPSIASPGGEKPCASALVRLQSEAGEAVVTTLWHRPLEVSDEKSKQALSLLDGTRDRDQLASEMDCSRDVLDREVATLGRLGLLAR